MGRTSGVFVCLALTVLSVRAQETPAPPGTVSGVVRDAGGAPVSGAKVSFTHQTSGKRRLTLTSREGAYEAGDLPPGSYLAEAAHRAHPKGSRQDFVLEAGQTLRLDFTLDDGSGLQTAPDPPPLKGVGRMRPAAPEDRPSPLAAPYAPAKAAVVLAVSLRDELGLPKRDLSGVDPEGPAPPGWEERLATARRILAEGRTDEAEALFRRLIDEHPVSAAPFLGIAECRLARGERAPGLHLVERISRELLRVGRHFDALEALRRTVEVNPGDADVHALLGASLVEVLHHEEAIAPLERAVELGRTDVRTLLGLASCYWDVGRYADSEKLFARTLELHGDSSEALLRLGMFLLWLDRPEEASGFLVRAREKDPDDVEVLFALGRAQAQTGRIDPAIATYEHLLGLAPERGMARHALEVLRKRRDDPAGARPRRDPGDPPPAAGRIVLTPVTVPGVDFVHDAGVTPERHVPEIMGSGLAWLDYDGDGWWDVYLVQSGAFPPDGGERSANRLYRNLGPGPDPTGARLRHGDGTVAFEDVTARTGTGDRSYGQGATAADVDGDGHTDLYLTSYGNDVLLSNRGDGGFEDTTAAAGLGAPEWSTSAAFADADADGDLDLYVARYLDYRPGQHPLCHDPGSGLPDYCDISLFEGLRDRFYVNEGGVFAERTLAAGVGGTAEDPVALPGFGVLWLDFDGNGTPDVYVTNDMQTNLLWSGNGDGTFEDMTLLSGAAYNWKGEVEASMGLAAGDVDLDGDADILVTHFDRETNTFYRNLGSLQFEDATTSSGLGAPSLNLLGFGVVLVDFDRDADLDAFVANGHVLEHPVRRVSRFLQPDLLFSGDGRGGFVEQEKIGPPDLGRGAATADYDNDGDLDLMVQNNREAPTLLRNDAEAGQWLGVELHGRGRNTAAVGAKVTLELDGRRLTRWVLAGDSYLSSSDKRLLFGWPEDVRAGALQVVWPSGRRSRYVGLAPGRFVHLAEPK